MQYTDVGEKTNTPFFVLIVFGSLSPFSGGQKRLLRRPDIFWHSLPSKETKMLQMLCCRRYCCLYNRQISAQKATSWGSLLSKFHCWENSSLVERFGTKLGLFPSYTGGTRWEGMMVQSCSGSAAKQGSLWHGALPHLHTVAATPCRTHSNSGTPAYLMELQMGQACADHQGKRWETEGWVCPKSSSRCTCQQRKHAQQLKHCAADHRPHPPGNSCTLKLRLSLKERLNKCQRSSLCELLTRDQINFPDTL